MSEAELFLSKGAPTEGSGLGIEAMEAGSEEIVTRRLVIGVGVTALAVGLANVRSYPITLSRLSFSLPHGTLWLEKRSKI